MTTESASVPANENVSPPPGSSQPVHDKDLFKKTIIRIKRSLVIVAVFSVIINILMLTTTIYLWQISDRVLVSRSIDTLIMLSILAIGALILLAIFEYLRRILLARIGGYFDYYLSGATYHASFEIGQHGDTPATQPLSDIGQVRNFISSPVMLFMFDAPTAPFYILLVYLIHPTLGLILSVGALVLLVFAFLNEKLIAHLQRQASGYAGAAFARAQAQIQNSSIVVAMGMQKAVERLWGRDNCQAIITQTQSSDRSAILTSLSSFVRMTVQISILGVGAYLTLQNELTAGAAIAASIIGGRGLAPIQGTIEGWKNYVQTRQSYERLKQIVNFSLATKSEKMILSPPKGLIQVQKVNFMIPGQSEPILRNISFELQPGDCLAIIGPSGSGKSTLSRLLVGALQPTHGTVRLDNTALNHWDPEQFGQHIGYLPQDIELFPGTIRGNISRFVEQPPDEAVVFASEITGSHEMISSLPDGYETMLAQNGAPLSGGQKQRVALARSFYGKPALIVMDEPNANLDNKGERFLAEAIQQAKALKLTTVLVTQRKQITQVADKLLILQQGQIQHFGTREEVMQEMANSRNTGQPPSNKNAPPRRNPQAGSGQKALPQGAAPSAPKGQRPAGQPPQRPRAATGNPAKPGVPTARGRAPQAQKTDAAKTGGVKPSQQPVSKNPASQKGAKPGVPTARGRAPQAQKTDAAKAGDGQATEKPASKKPAAKNVAKPGVRRVKIGKPPAQKTDAAKAGDGQPPKKPASKKPASKKDAKPGVRRVTIRKPPAAKPAPAVKDRPDGSQKPIRKSEQAVTEQAKSKGKSPAKGS